MKPTCAFDGCGKPTHSHGLCNSHAAQIRRGEVLSAIKVRSDAMGWLKDHVSYGNDECLIWPFHRSPDGYGSMKSRRPHRVMCALANGEPPTPKHEAAHSCGKGHEGCVNPRHLSWKTHRENMADMELHGTRRRGETIPWARLKDQDVLAIRRSVRMAVPHRTLAAQYAVSEASISDIALGKTWGHL